MRNQEGAPLAPDIFYLSKIFSLKKQLEAFDILQAPRPTHDERLWLVGFLRYVGYTRHEVFEIIDQHCAWSDYNPTITNYQIATVYNNHHTTESHEVHTHRRRARKWDLSKLEVYRIQLARTAAAHRSLERENKKAGVIVYSSPGEFKPSTLAGDFK